eukprot:6823152-Ditylum_brightwellii.AAC.1
MLLYVTLPLDSKLPEDKPLKIVLQLIPAGWKCTMICANFKPLEHSMEELVEYLKGVEYSENKNPPKRSNWNINSSGLKKAKKSKHKHDKGEESHNLTPKNTSNKKNCKLCKLCKMFDSNAEMHTTDRCNKNNLLSSLLDGHKKKHMERAKKE